MELFCLGFERCPNIEPSKNGTKVDRPRTKLVPFSNVDCIFNSSSQIFCHIISNKFRVGIKSETGLLQLKGGIEYVD